MKYVWILLFISWPVAAVALCFLSPAMGMWLPPEHLGADATNMRSVNPLGREIDGLFYLILWITGMVFLLTHAGLAWVLFSGARRSTKNHKAHFTHGNARVEVLWTVVPGLILLFIAFDQLDVWARFRVVEAFPAGAIERPLAELEAHQFGWQIRYPAAGEVLTPEPMPGDVYDHDRLYIPVGEPVLIWLRSRDVQHALYIPQFRVKQDAVPGQVIPVWFRADEAGRYQFLCAELCGWGHYKMGGMIVARPPAEHAAALEELTRENREDGVADSAVEGGG